MWPLRIERFIEAIIVRLGAIQVALRDQIANGVQARERTQDASDEERRQGWVFRVTERQIRKRSDTEERAYKQKNYRQQKVQTAISLAGLFGGLGIAAVAILQWREMTEATRASQQATEIAAYALNENQRQFRKTLGQMMVQNDAAKTSADAAKSAAETAAAQLEMTDRPWVTIDVLITGPLTYSDEGVQMNFSFVPKNIGHSPAQDVLISPQLIPVSMGDDVRVKQNQICKVANQTGFPKYTLFPDEPFTQPFGLGMSAESIAARWGKLPPNMGLPDPIPIALVGCVDYTYGTSRRHHQTGFALDVDLKDGRLPLRSLAPIPPRSLILRQHPNGGHFAN